MSVRFLQSLLHQGAIMYIVGFLAWVTAYVAVRKHEARKKAVQDGAALATGGTKQTSVGDMASREQASARPMPLPSCQLPKISQQAERQPSSQGNMEAPRNKDFGTPGRTAAAAPAAPPAVAAVAAEVAADAPEEGPVPLEALGIYVLRRMGLAPALCWLDRECARLADRIDEAIIVRSVCLPVVAYSLTYVVLARVQFLVSEMCCSCRIQVIPVAAETCTCSVIACVRPQNLDYGHVTYDVLILWMAAWFMLGR